MNIEGLTFGAFSEIIIKYGIPLLSLTKIIKDWLDKKKEKFPQVRITNYGKIEKIIIYPNEELISVKNKLEKIEKNNIEFKRRHEEKVKGWKRLNNTRN